SYRCSISGHSKNYHYSQQRYHQIDRPQHYSASRPRSNSYHLPLHPVRILWFHFHFFGFLRLSEVRILRYGIQRISERMGILGNFVHI
ncbi:hypothetical protein PENTCL1PPCAC_8263, partial [Pristionchus entomophagus]